MGREITRRDFLNGVSIAVGSSLIAKNSTWLNAFGIPQSPSLRRKTPAIIRPPKPACAALTMVRGKLRTNCAMARTSGPNPVMTPSPTIWSLSAPASAAWPQPTFTASLPDKNPKFSSSTTTMISAGTPSAMNFRRESDCCSDTAGPSPSKPPAITAMCRSGF